MKAGTSTYDAAPTLNALIAEMAAAGGGRITAWPGGQIGASETLLIRRGVQLMNPGHFSVGTRSAGKAYGLFGIKGTASVSTALVQIDKNCAGTLVEGLLIDATDCQAGTDGYAVEGSGTSSELRFNGMARGLMIVGAPGNGFAIWQGVGGYQAENVYSYNATGNCFDFEIDCADSHFYRLFGSNAGGDILNNRASSMRFHACDFWSAAGRGIWDNGSNNRYYGVQSDLNAEEGIRFGPGARRIIFAGGTLLSNSNGNGGASSEIHFEDGAERIMIRDSQIGSFPAAGGAPNFAAHALSFDGTAHSAISVRGCDFPSETFQKETFEAKAARWIEITEATDIGDSYSGRPLSFSSRDTNLVTNPDMQVQSSAVVDWTIVGGCTVSQVTDPDIGQACDITAVAADTDQYVEFVLTSNAIRWRGRRIVIAANVFNAASNSYNKFFQLTLGASDTVTQGTSPLVPEDRIKHVILPQYRIGATEAGNLKIRVKVKTAGQGAHTETMRVNFVQAAVQ